MSRDVTPDDMKHMRVWINLLSADAILSLSANLSPTMDPTIATRAVRDYESHDRSLPLDKRMAGLYEVVLITHKLSNNGLDLPLAQIGTGALKRVNLELDEWERSWNRNIGTHGLRYIYPCRVLLTRKSYNSQLSRPRSRCPIYLSHHHRAVVSLSPQLGIYRSIYF